MKRFIVEQSDEEFKGQDKISHTDIVRSMLWLLCLGKSDFEAVTGMRSDDYFRQFFGIKTVPSAETLRQRLDENAETLLPIINKCLMAMF